MMIETTSTFEISDRARAALARGKSFAYVTPDGDVVRIQYAAGGGYTSVSHRRGAAHVSSEASMSSLVALRLFGEIVQSLGRAGDNGFHAGVIASIGVLDERITKLDSQDGPGAAEVVSAAELRRTRRDLLELLNTEV